MRSNMFNRRQAQQEARHASRTAVRSNPKRGAATDAFITDRDSNTEEMDTSDVRAKDARVRTKANPKRGAGTDAFITDHETNAGEMDTDDVRMPEDKPAPLPAAVASKKKKANDEASVGHYVNLTQTGDGKWLRLVPNATTIREFIEDHKHHLGTEFLQANDPTYVDAGARLNVWGDAETLRELLQDHLSTGWEWVHPKEIGAVSSASILEAPDGRVYWHEKHTVESGARELLGGKTVSFEGAPDNQPLTQPAPMLDPEMELEEAGVKTSRKKKSRDEDPAMPPPATDPMLSNEPSDEPVDEPMMTKYKYWTAEALSVVIEALSKVSDFADNKAAQQAVAEMADELNGRPKSTPEAPKMARVNRMLQEMAKKKATSSVGIPPTNEETSEVLEGDKSIPDGREKVEDHTGIKYPSTVMPSKFAGEVSTTRAIKLCESTEEKLKALYLEAKVITQSNETRPVRDAVESIYHAMAQFGEAAKVLSKQLQLEEQEEEATKAVEAKKKSSRRLASLNIAAAEDEDDNKCRKNSALNLAAAEEDSESEDDDE